MSNKIKIIVVVGPTASGKSALTWKLAQSAKGGQGAEIVSADSRQVYRGLDIGTGKESFPQHLIDVADPKEDYNVSHFVRDAKKAIEEIHTRGKLPIVVGGSGFWIDSLIFGYQLPEVKPAIELRDELEKKTWQELFTQLEKLDHKRAKNIDRHNRRRLVRAVELVLTTGNPVPELKSTPQYDAEWIGIKIDKGELEKRIRERFMKWMDEGFIEEVRKLILPIEQGGYGLDQKRVDQIGLNYKYCGQFLNGEIDEEIMIELSIKSIIQYAKRQITWFKRNKNIKWIEKEEVLT